MSTTTAETRCPQCAAHIRPGSDWCTLCYADLRPAPEPVAAVPAPAVELPSDDLVAPAPTAPSGAAPVADAPAVPEPLPAAQRARGKHAKAPAAGEPAGSTAEADVLASQLLAQLAVHEGGNPLGKYSTLADSPGKKVGLMVGGCVAVAAFLFVLMAIAGLFF